MKAFHLKIEIHLIDFGISSSTALPYVENPYEIGEKILRYHQIHTRTLPLLLFLRADVYYILYPLTANFPHYFVFDSWIGHEGSSEWK